MASATYGDINKNDFKLLKERVGRMTTLKDKMRILKSAVSTHRFSAKQLRIMIKFGDFTKEKLDILTLMAPRLHYDDADSAKNEILKVFKYDDDKKMATDVLKRILKA